MTCLCLMNADLVAAEVKPELLPVDPLEVNVQLIM